ncbi:MAG: sugar phosphate isomerase/epimerase [Arenibacter algicola]|nr:sugar phosphate isomerase/epimerase [Arenibacter algicola]
MRLFIILFGSLLLSDGQEKVLLFQADWGNKFTIDGFCERAKTSGYDGVELWLPATSDKQEALKEALKKHCLLLNLLHGTNKGLPFKESLERYKGVLETLMLWKPVLINSQTGSDFFTMEENKAFIDAANTISAKHNIPVYHETHRGRFSYNLPYTNKYLNLIPDLKLTLDISHWMVVHESLLQGKDELLGEVIKKSNHIHARIGHAEGPQVNDPRAPEWTNALERHLGIWEQVIRKGWKENNGVVTVTTEFGPADYMPTLPYTRVPISDQWQANVFMMESLKERLKLNK